MDTIYIGILHHKRFVVHLSRRYTRENTSYASLNETLKLHEIGSAPTSDLEHKKIDDKCSDFPQGGVCERIRLPDPNQRQR